jgi:hypothetical protein
LHSQPLAPFLNYWQMLVLTSSPYSQSQSSEKFPNPYFVSAGMEESQRMTLPARPDITEESLQACSRAGPENGNSSTAFHMSGYWESVLGLAFWKFLIRGALEEAFARYK